jgi:hypothetical protein
VSPRRSFLSFAGLSLLGLLIVVLLARVAPPRPRSPFNTQLKIRLEKLDPEVVLIGNSMVNSRFSEKELARLIAPKRVAVLGIGGSKSAFWYLLLKNVILPVSKPKKILLFYRRYELTTPTDRALGIEHDRLARVTAEDDPFVEGMLAPRWDDPVARLGWHLERTAPVDRLRALFTPRLDDFASAAAALFDGKSRRRTSKKALETVFDVGKLRSSDLEPAGDRRERPSFEDALPHSFLPAIVELVNGAGAELTLVKVRTRSDAMETPKSPTRVSRYEKSLRRWGMQRGVRHLDLSLDAWETLSFYAEGDHTHTRLRRPYTRLFVKHHGEVFD